ncbi:Sensor protein fixL [Candidatus Terasakiella magnetica]|nr:Sensor protein fixL [Candidatus Terasakiella magnetica]
MACSVLTGALAGLLSALLGAVLLRSIVDPAILVMLFVGSCGMGAASGAALARVMERRMAATLHGRITAAMREVEQRTQNQLNKTERVAQLGSATHDLSTGCLSWSAEFHAILGMVPGQCQPSEALFLDAIHSADRERVADALHLAASQGLRIEEDFRVIRPDGQVRSLHGWAEGELAADGSLLRFDATIQDITERKRLEDELDSLIRELWRSNEELEEFAYVASHDLRQPLRVVGSYVVLLEEELQGNIQDDAADYMAFVRDGVRRMDCLITDLLTYSRVGRTTADLPVSLEGAILASLGDLQIEIEESAARIVLPDRLPMVMGDESELERLFLNLVGNAIKYRHAQQPPEIVIGCEDAGEEWLITVSDNGIGIPDRHADRVFGIFQRLHARDEYEGTGVGLAICKKIVERHGGYIRVEPDRAAGTTIALTWPKMRTTSDDG